MSPAKSKQSAAPARIVAGAADFGQADSHRHLVAEFNTEIDALHPEIGALRERRRRQCSAGERAELLADRHEVRVDGAVDLIAGTRDVAQVEEVVTDKHAP